MAVTYSERIAASFYVLSFLISVNSAAAQNVACNETRVIVNSHGWQLVGDLIIPCSDAAVPVALLLNQAAGDRTAYKELARQLDARGIASLRLDLRGHGESTNLGKFVPGEKQKDPKIWDAEIDVIAAYKYLSSLSLIDSKRIAIVGSSYSGEEMAEAGRINGYANSYVALSPGSFSMASISGIDSSRVPWLFVTSKDERFLQEIRADVLSTSESIEHIIVPGTAHATNILAAHPGVDEQIAVWLYWQFERK